MVGSLDTKGGKRKVGTLYTYREGVQYISLILKVFVMMKVCKG